MTRLFDPALRWTAVAALSALAGCAAAPSADARHQTQFGVLLMAHGGSPEWNAGVNSAISPLARRYPIEVAFGMADAESIQQAVTRLQARGVNQVGVVRLFISGESWYERTGQILGVVPGAPVQPDADERARAAASHGHSMAFWQVRSDARFALSKDGLADATSMGQVLADRARALSTSPQQEQVLILAHGPGDDAENQRWEAAIDQRADAVRHALPFAAVQVMTLREDWPDKREAAEQRVRGWVQAGDTRGLKTLVVPFRVHGFGPYSDVLKGLDYVSDGHGLVPHPAVTEWIADQAEQLRRATFEAPTVR